MSFAISQVSAAGENYFALLVDGSRFYYRTPAEKKEAERLAEAKAQKIQDNVERRIGRQLTPKELLKGKVEHPSNATIGDKMDQKIKWEKLFAPPKPEQTEENPHVRRLREHEEQKQREADPKGYQIRQDIAAWEAKHQQQEARAKLESDPLYQEAVGHAKGKLAAMQLDPRVDALDITEAENRLRLVESGRIEEYVQLANQAREKQLAALKLASRDIFIGDAKARAEINELSKPISVTNSENVVIVENPVKESQ